MSYVGVVSFATCSSLSIISLLQNEAASSVHSDQHVGLCSLWHIPYVFPCPCILPQQSLKLLKSLMPCVSWAKLKSWKQRSKKLSKVKFI